MCNVTIETGTANEIVMTPRGDQAASFEDVDAIGVTDGFDPVCDDNLRRPWRKPLQVFEDRMFRQLVQR